MEKFRLYEQKLPSFVQNSFQLSKKGILIGNLMNHEERQDKIDSSTDIDPIVITSYKFDPLFQFCPSDLVADFLQHSFLQVC